MKKTIELREYLKMGGSLMNLPIEDVVVDDNVISNKKAIAGGSKLIHVFLSEQKNPNGEYLYTLVYSNAKNPKLFTYTDSSDNGYIHIAGCWIFVIVELALDPKYLETK